MKVNCEICSKEYNIKPFIYQSSKTKKFFCTKSCFGIFQKNQKGQWNEEHKFCYIGPNKYKGQKRPEYIGRKISETRLNQEKIICEYCCKSFDKSSYTRYHGINCKSNNMEEQEIKKQDLDINEEKNYITICPDDYTYNEFIRKARIAYCKYYVNKNDGNISKTAKEIDIQRSHLYNIINQDKELFVIDDGELLKLQSSKISKSLIYNKKRDFDREIRLKIVREEFLELSEDELYSSMLPQYLYYMNIKEVEYDESDLIRLPLLIQHYKEINAEDKVEDLEETLEIIKKYLKLN